MDQCLRLPLGMENFEDIRKEKFYYVDKTGLIEKLLKEWSQVSLFTRPRRFGKTLNMSMLQKFFEIGCDKTLFDGTKIMEKPQICSNYMGQFPVISISLKSVDARSYEEAKEKIIWLINREARRFQFLLESRKLTEIDLALYRELLNSAMSETMMTGALQALTELLEKHYEKKVILLIDEYDVPLDKAFQNGYYDEMVSCLKGMLGNALKTNNSLQFSVLTGCLRIAKESIFTGLNNFKVYSIVDSAFDEYFGFTDEEVCSMLRYYGMEEEYETVKAWYDGYVFGDKQIYCPWDVINYCADHAEKTNLFPKNYWLNTSSNDIVRRFVNRASVQTRKEIEELIAGKTIEKNIHLELTYHELDASIDNLWSVLFTTGYLTQSKQLEPDRYELKIPNREIQDLFVRQIQSWFQENVRQDETTLQTFCEAFPNGKPEIIQDLFERYLWDMISVRDTATKEKKENFYHGILLGLLRFREDWYIKSNAESGEGYSDILIEIPQKRIGIVIELKYAEQGNLDAACKKALEQIKKRQYSVRLIEDGMKTILKYGIGCYRKACAVLME